MGSGTSLDWPLIESCTVRMLSGVSFLLDLSCTICSSWTGVDFLDWEIVLIRGIDCTMEVWKLGSAGFPCCPCFIMRPEVISLPNPSWCAKAYPDRTLRLKVKIQDWSLSLWLGRINIERALISEFYGNWTYRLRLALNAFERSSFFLSMRLVCLWNSLALSVNVGWASAL